MKTALVCDWIADIGGAETVIAALNQQIPSDIYCLFARTGSPEKIGLDRNRVHESFLGKLPGIDKYYRSLLPFFPFAIEQLNVSDADLVLSCSHSVAKGVLTHAEQLHISYVYTPMRYAWDLYFRYLRDAGLQAGFKGRLAQHFLHRIRQWDAGVSPRIHHYIGISHYVARRIKHVYGREADVIYPPVDTSAFELQSLKEDYYVTASRMVPYKMTELIVRAFNEMPDKRLVVIGDGPEFTKVKSIAKPNIELLGYRQKSELIQYVQKARAFVFAAEEDFGIAPVEAMACGTPVIAYGKGAALETVVDGTSGVFFEKQEVPSLTDAVAHFEKMQDTFDPVVVRRNAERFSKPRFMREMQDYVNAKMTAFRAEQRMTKGSVLGD